MEQTATQCADKTGWFAFRLQRCLLALIDGYRYLLSPLIGNQCRFYPTCSAYAREAILHHGPFRGASLAVRRLLKCNPWHDGGVDPVPACPHIRARTKVQP